MFNFFKTRKYFKLLKEIIYWGPIDEENWDKWKATHIECMIIACELDKGLNRRQACMEALRTIKLKRDFYLECMPTENYADLIVTLKNLA